MKKVFNFAGLVFAGLLLTGCASDKELRKLEVGYQAQLGEYATALKSGEITKAEHDKKVTQLNSRYGRRREMMERDIYGSGIKSPGRRPTGGRGGRRLPWGNHPRWSLPLPVCPAFGARWRLLIRR